ncbi:hypothetical protein SpCBS45565_g02264 [Spizellomyces sp. 'palustris']|nr:hypothetical protein SpCBS45565_g02264 [Spizellomyces sp. 'palustris']
MDNPFSFEDFEAFPPLEAFDQPPNLTGIPDTEFFPYNTLPDASQLPPELPPAEPVQQPVLVVEEEPTFSQQIDTSRGSLQEQIENVNVLLNLNEELKDAYTEFFGKIQNALVHPYPYLAVQRDAQNLKRIIANFQDRARETHLLALPVATGVQMTTPDIRTMSIDLQVEIQRTGVAAKRLGEVVAAAAEAARPNT